MKAAVVAEAMHLPDLEIDEWIEEAANVQKSDAYLTLRARYVLTFFCSQVYKR